jgi:hypothetical protein
MAVVHNNFTQCEIFFLNHVTFCGIELIPMKFLLFFKISLHFTISEENHLHHETSVLGGNMF